MVKTVSTTLYVVLVVISTFIITGWGFEIGGLVLIFYIAIVPTALIAVKAYYPDKPYYKIGIKVFAVISMIYLSAVAYISMANYNDWYNGHKLNEHEKEILNMYKKECQFHFLERNPWLLEHTQVFISNKKVFEHPEYLGILLKDISFDKNSIFRIYDEVEETKVLDYNLTVTKGIGKNLIMEIKK